jgi:predicted PurR-regulated permease PerM
VTKISANLSWQRALVVLTGTVVGVVVVSCLYWAQTVLVPVALAVFLSFLLTPLVSLLQRRGLRRTPSVIVVVLLAALVLGGVVTLVVTEVTGLAGELPTYTGNIREKVKSLRQMGHGTDRLEKMIQDITGEWKSEPGSPEDGQEAEPTRGPVAVAPEKLSAVVVQPESNAWVSRLPDLLAPVVKVLGGLALALVLVVFMLLKRENLRNRLIRLVGHGRMTVTTKALDDAGQRISRFLLMQLIINASFGLVLALGLLLIQVPHALLWGFVAALLRYVPYIGTWVNAGGLIILSLAFFPGWVQPCLVLALLVVLELVTGYVVEPRLFGRSMGVSEVALLVAAAFWAFLWGPIGLVLSSPLTVCLVVLGKYLPQLEFLDVLLGDEPSLDTDIIYYQRLLARDQDEATQLVLAHAKNTPLENVYDGLLVPGLNFVKQDRERDDLTEVDELFILRATREIVEDLGERQVAAAGAANAPAETEGTVAPAPRKVRILGCPGSGEADRLALEMLRQLLEPARWDMEVLSMDLLSAEVVASAGEKDPAVVCIGALPPGGLARTRYLCKRLRARLPNAKIVVGRWGLKVGLEQNQEQLLEAGADQVETTLLETRTHLSTWLPVLAQEGVKTASNGAPKDGRLVAV